MCGCLSCASHWGPGPKPRHVPWLGIEPVTLRFAGGCSIQSATPARAQLFHLKMWGHFICKYFIFSFFFITNMDYKENVIIFSLSPILTAPNLLQFTSVWFTNIITFWMCHVWKSLKTPHLKFCWPLEALCDGSAGFVPNSPHPVTWHYLYMDIIKCLLIMRAIPTPPKWVHFLSWY